jgi:antitoxin (DNA-binding transcriptional repressor) of toxin-antitoxin stability system
VTIVGAQDGPLQFAAWLQRVERGEELVIARDGHPIARLVPAKLPSAHIEPRVAIAELQQIASRNKLGGLQVKDLAAEGRR